MPQLPFTPSSASRSAWVGAPARDEHSGSTALPIPSSVRNADVSAATFDPPTYQEATDGSNRVMQNSGMNALLRLVPPGGNKLIGRWEAEKWRQVSDTISEFANSSIAAEGNFSAEKVIPVVRAITTWTDMVKQTPPMMALGDPYDRVMDRTVTDALKQLGSFHNDLKAHAGQMQPFNSSRSKPFVDLADTIQVFIEGMK